MSNVARIVQEIVVDARPAEEGARRVNSAFDKVEAQIQRLTTSVTQGTARQAAQWDRIAAAIDPVVAANQRLERAQTAGAAAMARGRITLDEYNRVLGTYRERLDQAQRAAAGVQQPIQQMNGAVALSSQQLAGMQFQLQDMAVGLASGQSPFMVIAQQGSQLAQSFASGTGVLAALKAVGAGLVTFFLNPLNLVVIGLAAAAAAVSFFWNAVSGGGEDANAVTERSAQLVDEISEAYREAEKAAGGFYDVVTQGNLFELQEQMEDQRDAVRASLKTFTDEFLYGIGGPDIQRRIRDLAHDNSAWDVDIVMADENLPRLIKMIEQFRFEVNHGGGDAKQFADDLAGLALEAGSMSDAMQQVIRDLIAMLQAPIKADEVLQHIEQQHWKLTAAVVDTDGSIKSMHETLARSPAAFTTPLGPIQQFVDALVGLNVQLQGSARLMGLLMGPVAEGGRGLLSGASDFVNRAIVFARAAPGVAEFTEGLLQRPAPNVPIPRINPARDLTSDYGVAEIVRQETEARKAATDAAREQQRAELELQRARDTFAAPASGLATLLMAPAPAVANDNRPSLIAAGGKGQRDERISDPAAA